MKRSKVHHRKADICAVAAFFRASGKRSKLLKERGGVATFPAFFEVRFSQHLALITAVLKNLEVCRDVWEEMRQACPW